jgi:hypothetical protein
MEVELYFRNIDSFLLNMVIRVFKSPSKIFNQASLSDMIVVLKVYDILNLIIKKSFIFLFESFITIIILRI